MAENKTNESQLTAKRDHSTSMLAGILSSPLLWGAGLTFGFYQLISILPIHRELATRYFCSHPLEYVTSALFFLGIAILGIKAVGVLRERKAFRISLTDSDLSSESSDLSSQISKIEERLALIPSHLVQTHLVERIQDIVDYVRSKGSAEGLEQHVRYLAELASDRVHRSYAFVRTVAWAVPILGFLGTVMGITIAIANVTPEQLDSSLSTVTGGLAVAFDTTALALTLSLVLAFGWFVVERSEQQVLASVEELAVKQIPILFPPPAAGGSPLANAEADAAHNLIERTESLIRWQTEIWQDALESLRKRWVETLDHQQQAFVHALDQGMSLTLENHSSQLESVREEFLQGYRAVSRKVGSTLGELSHIQAGQQSMFDRQFAELQRHGELILKFVSQEERLLQVQERLDENLQTIRNSDTFEETLQSLGAAINLLTARTKAA